MRRLHCVVGILAVTAFVVSGAYLRFCAELDSRTPGEHLLFVSRHIYMLGPALAHLVLAAYVRLVEGRVVRLQWAGTWLLVIASILMITAFVFEPVGGRDRTAVSAFGIFSFWAGAMLHVISPLVSRWRAGR